MAFFPPSTMTHSTVLVVVALAAMCLPDTGWCQVTSAPVPVPALPADILIPLVCIPGEFALADADGDNATSPSAAAAWLTTTTSSPLVASPPELATPDHGSVWRLMPDGGGVGGSPQITMDIDDALFSVAPPTRVSFSFALSNTSSSSVLTPGDRLLSVVGVGSPAGNASFPSEVFRVELRREASGDIAPFVRNSSSSFERLADSTPIADRQWHSLVVDRLPTRSGSESGPIVVEVAGGGRGASTDFASVSGRVERVEVRAIADGIAVHVDDFLVGYPDCADSTTTPPMPTSAMPTTAMPTSAMPTTTKPTLATPVPTFAPTPIPTAFPGPGQTSTRLPTQTTTKTPTPTTTKNPTPTPTRALTPTPTRAPIPTTSRAPTPTYTREPTPSPTQAEPECLPLRHLEATSSRFWFEIWPKYERGVTDYWAYVSSETKSCVTVQTEGNMTASFRYMGSSGLRPHSIADVQLNAFGGLTYEVCLEARLSLGEGSTLTVDVVRDDAAAFDGREPCSYILRLVHESCDAHYAQYPDLASTAQFLTLDTAYPTDFNPRRNVFASVEDYTLRLVHESCDAHYAQYPDLASTGQFLMRVVPEETGVLEDVEDPTVAITLVGSTRYASTTISFAVGHPATSLAGDHLTQHSANNTGVFPCVPAGGATCLPSAPVYAELDAHSASGGYWTVTHEASPALRAAGHPANQCWNKYRFEFPLGLLTTGALGTPTLLETDDAFLLTFTMRVASSFAVPFGDADALPVSVGQDVLPVVPVAKSPASALSRASELALARLRLPPKKKVADAETRRRSLELDAEAEAADAASRATKLDLGVEYLSADNARSNVLHHLRATPAQIHFPDHTELLSHPRTTPRTAPTDHVNESPIDALISQGPLLPPHLASVVSAPNRKPRTMARGKSGVTASGVEKAAVVIATEVGPRRRLHSPRVALLALAGDAAEGEAADAALAVGIELMKPPMTPCSRTNDSCKQRWVLHLEAPTCAFDARVEITFSVETTGGGARRGTGLVDTLLGRLARAVLSERPQESTVAFTEHIRVNWC